MEATRKIAVNDFYYFVEHIFSASFDDFILGEHVASTCKFLQDNNHTIRVSSRVHFKSLSLYAHVMWSILKMHYHETSVENHYFSYKAEMAAYHVGNRSNRDNIRALIERNPFFEGIIDNKPTAEAILDYSWTAGGAVYTLHPHGMMTFKRGLHCNGTLYVDDALQDPAEKLDPKVVHKINDIFYTQLLDIPLGDMSEIHVVGTAQTEDDFYFDERSKELFAIRVLPGVSDIKADEHGWIISGTPLWIEWMDIEAHRRKQRSQGIKTYSQEYLCNPVYSADSFFQKWQLEALVGALQRKKVDPDKLDEKQLKIYDEEERIGGWDLGKHAHPAHFAAFAFRGGKAVQIYDKWFDGVDYTDQYEHIEKVAEDLDITTVFYDNTRGELEILEEQGLIGAEFEPVSFTLKKKHAMATEFERYVTQGKLKIIDNERTIRQICLVTNDLKARETKEGHGDSFFSFALCFAGALQPTPDIYIAS